jgi:hypothetical protein
MYYRVFFYWESHQDIEPSDYIWDAELKSDWTDLNKYIQDQVARHPDRNYFLTLDRFGTDIFRSVSA